jgi:membrane associated rhomboid family serine protease
VVSAAVSLLLGAIYVLSAWPRLAGPVATPVLLAYGALYTPLPAAQWPRVVTTWFVHVDPIHLIGNLAAWAAAWLPWPQRRLERPAVRLLSVVGCGLGASVASLLWYGPRAVVSVGPSGALLGLLVVALLQRGRAPRARLVWLLAATALLLGGILSGGDTAAHIGGAACGLAIGLLSRATSAE